MLPPPCWAWSAAILAVMVPRVTVYLSIWSWASVCISLTKASAKALATAWASSGVDPDPVTVRAPVVESTVPVTCPANADTFGSWSVAAAASWTAVLDSSWTGSGRVKADEVPPVVLGALIWMSALDWYVGVTSLA